VMLSAESAMGRFPEEAVATLAAIAAETERHRASVGRNPILEFHRGRRPETTAEAVATVVEHGLDAVPCDVAFVPTHTGTTARMLSRFKPDVWIVAASGDRGVCQGLAFSYGVWPVDARADQADWRGFAGEWLKGQGMADVRAMLVSGPSAAHPDTTYRLEFMRLPT